MKELDGYAGKMLRVDLSSGEVTEFSSSPYLPKYLGGRGLAARLYWDEIKREIEPFEVSLSVSLPFFPLYRSV